VVACLVTLELYLGVVVCMFGGGPVILGLGLALDAGARVIGTIAAARLGKQWGSGWRWICALLGSPGVAYFAFQRDSSLMNTDLVPLAGPIAGVALFVLFVGLALLPAGV
jgi:hypothetical protein